MREIRFRGKSVVSEDFIYGDLIQCRDFVKINCDFGHDFTVDKNTIGQFTGLKDKNGKEIYEGDIMITIRQRGYVAWSDKYCAFVYVPVVTHPNYLSKEPILLYAINTENWEMAGNIHDNPELLNND